MPSIEELPPPPAGKTGWPWTEVSGPRSSQAQPSTKSPDLPSFGIVTPSFNQGVYLEETIRSVLLQNYPNLQYIVIDGGSTDDSVEIIKKYAKWLTYWTTEKDQGQSDAICKGLSRLSTEWVNWINSDDFLMPGAIHHLACLVSRIPRLARPTEILVGKLLIVDQTSNAIETRKLVYRHSMEDFLVNTSIIQPAMFYRANHLRSLDTKLHFAMDLDVWARTVTGYGLDVVATCEEVIAAFRMQPKSKTTTNPAAFETEERLIFARICASLGSDQNFLNTLTPHLQRGTIRPVSTDHRSLSIKSLEKELLYRYVMGDIRTDMRGGNLRLAAKKLWPALRVAPGYVCWHSLKEVAKLLRPSSF